jgi:Domain of unknown function (DUF4287)
MPAASSARAAGIGDDAVRAKTGKGWTEWFTILDKAGAKKWPHKEIAEFLADEHGCPPWWRQMITVGYEQARGLRVKHQTAAGYIANASKTIAVPIAKLYAAWVEPKLVAKWLPEAKKMTVRKATVNRSLRITWIDGNAGVEAMFYAKGPAKSQVAVQHGKLASTHEVTEKKEFWGERLDKLSQLLSGDSTRKSGAR